MGLALVLCLYDCCSLTPPRHSHTQPHPNNSLKVCQIFVILLGESFSQCSIGSSVMKRNEAVAGGKKCLTVHLEVDWRDLGQGQTFPSVLLLSFPVAKVGALSHTHFRPFSSVLYGFSRAAREISLHQDLLCALQSRRGGEYVCVCVISDCAFFCNGGYFSLLWRILLLRSEEAGYLPASDCAEVITVLYWKEGVQEWGLGRGS